MKINSINYIPLKTLNISKQQNPIRMYSQLSKDTVSFSGKNYVKKENTNVDKGVDFGNELLQIPISQEITLNYISEILSDIKVLPIEQLKSERPDAENYGAFYSGILSPDYSVVEPKIYLDVDKANQNPINRLGFIMNSAHEYTHHVQAQKGDILDYLKTVSKNDHEYAKAIQGIGTLVFKPFDNEIQSQACVPVFRNPEDILALKKYGMIVPREKQVSKNDILRALGLKDEKEFKTFINKTYNDLVQSYAEGLFSDPLLSDWVKDKGHVNRFYSKIKKYCAMKAGEEKEAYTTESKIAKTALKTDKSLNIDIFPIYYEMLEKALS